MRLVWWRMTQDEPTNAIPPVMTIQEVADLLRLSVRTVLRDPPPSIRLAGRSRRYRATDVLRWLDERGRAR